MDVRQPIIDSWSDRKLEALPQGKDAFPPVNPSNALAAIGSRKSGPFLGFTIERGRLMDGEPVFFVIGWDRHPLGTSLEGRLRRHRVGCFGSLDDAKRSYPNAHVLKHGHSA